MEAKSEVDMIYTIEDVPPWYLCILLGLQVNGCDDDHELVSMPS